MDPNPEQQLDGACAWGNGCCAADCPRTVDVVLSALIVLPIAGGTLLESHHMLVDALPRGPWGVALLLGFAVSR